MRRRTEGVAMMLRCCDCHGVWPAPEMIDVDGDHYCTECKQYLDSIDEPLTDAEWREERDFSEGLYGREQP